MDSKNTNDNLKEREFFLTELKKERKEKKVLERKVKELQYILTSYEQNAIFQNNIYKMVKQQKEEQDIFLNHFLENTPDVIMVLDKNLKFILSTKSALKRIGINADTLMGKDFKKIFINIFSESLMDRTEEMLYEVLNTGNPKTYDDFELRINGNIYYFIISAVPFRNGTGEIIGILYSLHNITKLHEAIELAEKSNKAKTIFLAKMSHEIRTPMNSIIGMAELILREDIQKNIRENALSIKQASVNLMAIINDILDFSKIESGMLEIIPSAYQLSSVINDVISIIRMKAADKNVLFVANVDSKLPDKLIGDESRIRQVLLNLLTNAYKYCNEGYIGISVEGEIIEKNYIELRFNVSDSGIGIKDEDLDKLFGDFIQVDMIKNKSVEGTGLGLAITKNLCQAMGGNLSVKSVYGKGSTFTAVIPQKYDSYERFAIVENPEEKSVLIYEPRKIYSDSIIRSIENLGVRCKTVINRSQLLEELENNTYSFIFVSSFLYEIADKLIKKLRIKVKLILFSEYGEAIIETKDVKTIIMPAHSISIANALNNVTENTLYNQRTERSVRFIAPKAKILIVDDINTNLKVAEGMMLPYKMQIDLCKSGKEALELVQENKYDLVFMDHMMPEMDGVETLVAIRNLYGEYYEKLPIVALTANAVTGVKEMFLQNGFNDFLAKPIDILKLAGILENWLPKEKREVYVETEKKEENLPIFRIEGIDVISGISRTGGNLENYFKTLEVFFKDCGEKIIEIKQCLKAGNIELYTTHVHALKSAALSVGAVQISEQAKLLENAGKNEDSVYISKNNEGFIKDLKNLLEHISNVILAAHSNKDSEITDNNKVKNQIQELKIALDVLDIGTVDKIIANLRNENTDDETNDILGRIESNILICEYEQALKLSDKLLSIL